MIDTYITVSVFTSTVIRITLKSRKSIAKVDQKLIS
jgi:hypothetical protein